MTAWLELDIEQTTIALCRDSAQLPDSAPAIRYPVVTSFGELRRPLSTESSEAPNVTISIDNGSGAVTNALNGLYGLPARLVHDSAGVLLSGRVRSFSMGAQGSIEIVDLALLEPPVLRQSTTLAEFDGSSAIPHVIGRGVRYVPQLLNETQTRWRLADHRIALVRSVEVDGRALNREQFELKHSADSSGGGVAILELSQAVRDSIVVTVDGAISRDTGQVIENPADIAAYLLGDLGGAAPDDVDRLRSDANGLVMRGLIDGTDLTLKALTSRIMSSAGVLWSAAAPEFGRYWPTESASPEIAGIVDAATADVTAEQLPIINRLVVVHDYDWSLSEYRKAIIMDAPESIERHGRTFSATLELPWVAESHHAKRIAERHLSYRAAEVYRYSWALSSSTIAVDATPGQVWSVQSPVVRACAEAIVIDAVLSIGSLSASVQAEGRAGDPEPVRIVSIGRLIEGLVVSPVVSIGDDFTELQIFTPDGSVAPSAVVILGGIRRVADANGIARFPLPGGQYYRLEVYAAGFDPIVIEQYQVV